MQYRSIAQLAELRPFKTKVHGSNPCRPTKQLIGCQTTKRSLNILPEIQVNHLL